MTFWLELCTSYSSNCHHSLPPLPLAHIKSRIIIRRRRTTTIFIVLSSWPRSLREFTRFIAVLGPSSNDDYLGHFKKLWLLWLLHLLNVEQRQAAADPQTKPPDLGCESLGCYRLQPPSPLIIITQPESWDILVQANPGRHGKWPLKRRERESYSS